MQNGVTVLNLDQTYLAQASLQQPDYEWIQLTGIPGTTGYCEAGSLAAIGQYVHKRRRKGITFIGNGNYHYVSYLLLSEIREPFTLVLFDHHTDMLKAPFATLISCGSWVSEALEKQAMLEKVVIVGANPDLMKGIPPQLSRKVTVFPESDETCTGGASLARTIVSEISGRSVYISIDKDVLDRSEAVTNWDQGSMKLASLLEALRFIASQEPVCGVDVCGEYPYSPLELYRKESRLAVRKNERANRLILDALSH